MHRLDVVIPLKINAREKVSDLDRFTSLLMPSFDRFFQNVGDLQFTLIVPEGDVRSVNGRIRETGRSNVSVICEDELCPSLKSVSGWYKQQILKLAAARLEGSPYYLVLDANVILKRPCCLLDFFPGGRPILQRVGASVHWDWWLASRKILKSSVTVYKDSDVMCVTPQFLHRATCLDLQATIASRNNTDCWERFLFESRAVGWTEYTLYWLFVLEQGLADKLYDWSGPRQQLFKGIWERAQFTPKYLKGVFESDSFFVVVQSNIGLDLELIRKRISPYWAERRESDGRSIVGRFFRRLTSLAKDAFG